MDLPRRAFLRATLGAGAALSAARREADGEERRDLLRRLDDAAEKPVLRVDGRDGPVTIAALEPIRHRRNFVVRARAADGAEGVGVPNAMHLVHTDPIFLNRVAPFFAGKDARRLEPLRPLTGRDPARPCGGPSDSAFSDPSRFP